MHALRRRRSFVVPLVTASVLLLALAFWAISHAATAAGDQNAAPQARIHRAPPPHPVTVASRDILTRGSDRLAVLEAALEAAREPGGDASPSSARCSASSSRRSGNAPDPARVRPDQGKQRDGGPAPRVDGRRPATRRPLPASRNSIPRHANREVRHEAMVARRPPVGALLLGVLSLAAPEARADLRNPPYKVTLRGLPHPAETGRTYSTFCRSVSAKTP